MSSLVRHYSPVTTSPYKYVGFCSTYCYSIYPSHAACFSKESGTMFHTLPRCPPYDHMRSVHAKYGNLNNDRSNSYRHAFSNWFLVNNTPSQISSSLCMSFTENQLRADDLSRSTFAEIAVENVGAFPAAWRWFTDISVEDIGKYLSQGTRRLISIDTYMTSLRGSDDGQQRRAWQKVVVVSSNRFSRSLGFPST